LTRCAGATNDPFSYSEGVGSGVIFDPTGWILTNHHVVQGSDQLTVTLKDDRKFKGTVYGNRYADRPRHREDRCIGPTGGHDR
jgi:S1-C subfamily serine protease